MKDSFHEVDRPTVRRSNGGYHIMNYGRRASDIGDASVSFKVSRLVKVGLSVIVGSFVVGTLYMHTSTRLDRLECGQRMLVDVVVFKKNPEQPNCDR